MIFLIPFFLLISLFFECYGFMFRILGAINNAPTLGYSLHVQIATIARFGTLLAFPLIALEIETGISDKALSLIPVITYVCLAIMLSFFSRYSSYNIMFTLLIFRFLKKFSGLKEQGFYVDSFSKIKDIEIPKNQRNKIIYFGTFAFLFTSGAFFLTSIVANHFLDYRTTIIQCTPFVSSIGTLMSVIYFDPTISQLIDKNPNSLKTIVLAWKARINGALIISLFFALFYFLS